MYRAYLDQIGNLEEDLDEFERVCELAARWVAQAAQQVAHCPTGRARYNFPLLRAAVRVAHLPTGRAPPSTGRAPVNCLKSLQFFSFLSFTLSISLSSS